MAPLTWLITGCSTGMGMHLVNEIADRGDNVIATARRLDSITSQFQHRENVKCLQLDVTEKTSVLEDKVQEALGLFGGVDVLFNNAGYVTAQPFEEISEDKAYSYMDTMFFGVTRLVKAILPHFRSRRAGWLVYSSSMYSFGPSVPGGVYYAAAKHAVSGFARTLDVEVSQFGIRTLLIDSGYFNSDLISKIDAKQEKAKLQIEEYQPLFNAVLDGVTQLVGKFPGDPVKIAKVTVDLVRGEGTAEGRKVPIRIPMGSDAFALSNQTAEESLTINKDWDDVIRGIDV